MDNEVKGTGNQYDYGFRIYNPRIAKFLSVDPLFKTYPWYSPYQYAGNSPIAFIDLDGLERVLAITYNGDVNYRASHLELMNGDEISRKVITDDPAQQLADAFVEAFSADKNGIGFVAIWGHGTSNKQWGTDASALSIDDLGPLRKAVKNGDVSFTDNAIIYIGNCNSGTCNSEGKSFGKEIADITGARVIAGEGSVGVKEEGNGKMEYTMYYPNSENFKMFDSEQEPIELGSTIDIGPLLERGKSMQMEKIESNKFDPIQVETPESQIIED